MSATDEAMPARAIQPDLEHAHFEGNERFGVEAHGFDYIPEHERRMSLRSLGLFWAGTNLYLFNFVIGAIVLSLGLQVWQAFAAVLVGNLTYGLVALGSRAGSRSGLPTVTIARGAFGINANRLNAVLGWLDSILFEAFSAVFAVFAVSALFVELGWDDPGNTGRAIGLLVVYASAVVIATLGHATVVWLQRLFAFFLGLVMLVVLGFTVSAVDLSAGAAGGTEPTGSLGIFLLAAGLVAASGLAYMVTPCDFSRYLPSATPGRAHALTVFLTAAGTSIFLGLMGVMLAAQADLSDPVTGVEPLVPGWLYVLFVLAVIGGSTGNCVISLYNSGLTLQATGLPLKRYQATLLDALVAGSVISFVLFVQEDFQATLNDGLALLLVWVGPFGAIWLTDAVLRRYRYDAHDIHNRRGGRYFGWHGVRPKAVIALAAGMLVAFASMNAPINQGVLSRELFADGDLSWILGPVVSAVVYVVLAGRDVLREEGRTAR